MSTGLRRCLICALAVVAVEAVADDGTWRMATAAHYRVLSQVNDRDTRAWMRDFDQFILSTADVLHMDLRSLPPLTVVIFSRDKDYAPYKLLRPNGETANTAGQFVRQPSWSMIGMAHDSDSLELRTILQHEATHWLMSTDRARQPAWFAEGIAEMFSTFERHVDKVNWAKPIAAHLRELHESIPMPLAQFLVVPGALFDREDHTQRFYAQAWAFTHFLMMSKDPKRRELLFKFLRTYREQSGEATVQAVFGSELPNIEREFHLYTDQRSFLYMQQPAKSAPDPPALEPAPAALVEASLGALALGAQHPDLSRQRALKAIELDPSAPDGYRVLAYLAQEEREWEQAARQANAALERGSKDEELYLLVGDSYANGANSEKANASRTRIDMYENAINVNPRQLDAYERLTVALFAVNDPRPEDAKFMELGLRAFPGDDWLRLGAAAVAYRLGHTDAALSTVDGALRPESTLDEGQRRFALNLKNGWLLESMRAEIETAQEKQDFTAARDAVARYRERVGKDPDAGSYLDKLDAGLQLTELTAQYNAAVRARNKAEAHRLARQLLARADLPENLRHYIQQYDRP
jgi:hypothetical protein